jgi:proline racemase/trans-L-3-hydroxyproline dehydratase
MPSAPDTAAVEAVDYHTAGEPFRIVTGGGPEVPGARVRDRREAARRSEAIDRVRRLLCHEPRGHAGMYGCFVVPPDDGGAQLGAVFWHKDGYSTACGHGTVALGAWAVESGRVTAVPDGVTDVVIDVPSGRVTARVQCRAGAVASVAFRNVPSYVIARRVPVRTGRGAAVVDVSYGGAIYASVPASAFGLEVRPDRIGELVAAGRAVKGALAGSAVARHATDERLSGIYGTILYEELPPIERGPRQRNITVFADGQVDRSPCGSGTSARLALLAEDGTIAPGEILTHESVIDTVFTASVVATSRADGRDAVLTEVVGTAYPTGEHRFWLDPRDGLGPGFMLS